MTLLVLLSTKSIVAIFVALFLVSQIVTSVRAYIRLRHIPGPKLNAWTNLRLIWMHFRGKIDTDLRDWDAKYGPLTRVGPNHLVTSDPEQWRAMSAARSPYRRSDWYHAMRLAPGSDNVVSTRDEHRHDELRRKMALGYSGKENPRLENSIDECVRDFVSLVERNYLSDKDNYKPMDLGQKVQFFTLDVISSVAFDNKFGDLRDDNDNMNYIHETEAAVPILICFTVMPEAHRFLEKSRIMAMLAPSVKDKTGLGRVIGIAAEMVDARFTPDGKLNEQDDMLGSFLRHGLSREEAKSEAVLQIIAGSDTTATGIRSIMLHIISNPHVYQRLMAEIAEGESLGLIPHAASDHVITDENARKLPYLQACIKEGLRIYPPVTGMTSKLVPDGGREISGYFVPGGTRIGYCALGIHHSTAVFGADAAVFRPERWLLASSQGGSCASPEQLLRMERNNELIFSNGRFQCLGKSVAAIELNKVVLELLKRFEFSVVKPLAPWESWCSGIYLQKNFWVRVQKRELKEDV